MVLITCDQTQRPLMMAEAEHVGSRINNNYSPKWRWLVMDIYRTAKHWGKYPRLVNDTEVNNCFSIYYNSEIIEHKNDDF